MRGIRKLAGALPVAAIICALLILGSATPSDAQSSRVLVSVRTEPVLPQPGDDVSVRIRITGCPPGDAVAEIYLTTDDGTASTSAVMARSPAITSLVFRGHADLVLKKAIEGWYGVRVVCGTFRPERKPMANTSFAVGAKPTKESRVVGTSVTVGGSIRLEGDGCPGSKVEYQIVSTGLHVGAFLPTGELPVAPDGTWGGDVTMPSGVGPGSAQIRRRCVLKNQLGDTVTINYGDSSEISVLRSGPGTPPAALAPPAPTLTPTAGP